MRFHTLGATLAAIAILAACQRSTTNQEIDVLTDGTKTPAVNEVPARTGSAPASLPSVIVADQLLFESRLVSARARFATGELEPYQYNPIEGTVSQGDIWRVKNGAPGAPAIWVTADTAANFNADRYTTLDDTFFKLAHIDPLSTFSVDVDSASYTNVRRFLNEGNLPPADAVRIEEFVNFFRYDYPQPTNGEPFSVAVETSECPWEPQHRLVRIGLGGHEIPDADRPGSNLVFLVDVSGSMNPADRLPLAQASLKNLVEQLDARDTVSMVVYAGTSGLVLPATSGAEKATILDAIDRLRAGGSTAGGAGVQLAYKIARENFLQGGANRVILCTDGDFNVGTTSTSELVSLVEQEAKSGVYLTVLGFGRGNLNDAMLEQITNKGNGNYAYIDSLAEGRRVLAEQAGGTLFTIAKDVKIQVEFNPAKVQAYRLIGYQNRMLQHQDFNDDRKDAGDIGSGHQVTALYEVVPVGVDMTAAAGTVDPLKYQRPANVVASNELLTVKLRYKQPDGDTSRLLEVPVHDKGSSLMDCSDDFIFAASVAGFGMILRQTEQTGLMTLGQVKELAASTCGTDKDGRRAEFVRLVERTIELAAAK
ncbi:MAG: VWA domain-containing protein [Candidatus Sumerlaeia bacterium]|nr:VWA domain-containing protein [Candidatus Sumerlaeia bacterium]